MDLTSVSAHVEVATVSRVELHREHMDRGAERCKEPIEKQGHNIERFTGGTAFLHGLVHIGVPEQALG